MMTGTSLESATFHYLGVRPWCRLTCDWFNMLTDHWHKWQAYHAADIYSGPGPGPGSKNLKGACNPMLAIQSIFSHRGRTPLWLQPWRNSCLSCCFFQHLVRRPHRGATGTFIWLTLLFFHASTLKKPIFFFKLTMGMSQTKSHSQLNYSMQW